ncbi:MAG: response regulator [Pararhodobacter sp.]
MRIVILDGNPLTLNALSAMLEAIPACEIILCTTAADAIAACTLPTDLAIFGTGLPDFDTAEAVARLRAGPQTEHLPVLLLTDDSGAGARQAAIRAGASDWLTKPVQGDELRLRLRNLLALHQAQKQASVQVGGWQFRPDAPCALAGAPVPGAAGRFPAAAPQDLTDLRAAHDRMAGRLTDIAQVSGAWFFEVDAGRRLTYVSDQLARALGTTPAQVLGLTLDQLPVQPDEADLSGPWGRPLFSPPYRPIEHDMIIFRLPNDQTRAIQINAVPFHDAQGVFAGYRGHASDVTAIARARDLAAKASHAKTAFLATMSHEMRTPLTAIIGLAELMARDPLLPAQKDHLDDIARAAAGLAGILSDVLDVASMEQGRLTLDIKPFDPAEIIAQAVAPPRLTARTRGLGFDWRTDCGQGTRRLGDGARLRQIVQALVSNAVKFTEHGGVSVQLDCRDADELRLTVTDSGIGMQPEEQVSAFTPFIQVDAGIARRFEGTGLGLSIARWLTRAMGGSIALESVPGQGTIVRVSLPLPRVAEAPVVRADLGGWRVLVADDNRTNRKILQAMLGRMGADVTLCEDGPEALAHWRQGAFDMLLLDINMPKMAGTEVIRRIRSQEIRQGAAPVPAIAVTANARPEQVAQYRLSGFDGCVPKPFTAASLAAALREHAGRTAA